MRRFTALLFTIALIVPGLAAAQDVHLRGQFVPTRAPEADTRPATGEARAVVEVDGDTRVDLVVSGLTERATSATLHAGDAGDTTEQVASMPLTVNGGEARAIGATVTLTPAVAAQIRAGDAYIVIRTNEHPDGVLRAQLVPQAKTLESVASGQ